MVRSVLSFASLVSLSSSALGVEMQSPSESCSWTDPDSGAIFDMRPLRVGDQSSYRVQDLDHTEQSNYTYVFNVCGDAEVPVPDCEETESGRGNGPAFQIFNDGTHCRRLGKDKDLMEWNLIDEINPAGGVELTYINGDVCESHPEIMRTMTIRFVCAQRWGDVPDALVEENNCHYSMEFETIFGCPVQCPFQNNALCGGNGFCGMDTDKHVPKCFCNHGWHGADCNTEGELEAAGCTGFCVALVFALVLLVGLLAASGVIYWRVHKLAQLNLRFGDLTQSFTGRGEDVVNEEETFGLKN